MYYGIDYCDLCGQLLEKEKGRWLSGICVKCEANAERRRGPSQEKKPLQRKGPRGMVKTNKVILRALISR